MANFRREKIGSIRFGALPTLEHILKCGSSHLNLLEVVFAEDFLLVMENETSMWDVIRILITSISDCPKKLLIQLQFNFVKGKDN